MKGHIRKRGSKYSVVLDIGRKEDGSRNRKWFSGFDTKKAAQKFLNEKLHEIEKGTFIVPAQEIVQEFLQSWLEDKKHQVKQSTWISYRWLVNRMTEHIGSLKISNVKPQHIQKLYNTLQTGPDSLSARSVLQAHSVLHDAFERAVKWDMVVRNVIDMVDPPRTVKRDMTIWTKEEAWTFLECAKLHRNYVIFLLAITTGMRQGEILGLEWKSIDLEAGKISVVRSYSKDTVGYSMQEVKSASSYRSIVIPQEVVDALKKKKVQIAREKLRAGELYQDHDLVTPSSTGTPMNPSNLFREWGKLIKRAGVPYIRFHDLRHTHATLMLQEEVHPKIVQERLGHSNISITLDTYSHVLPNIQEEATSKFAKSFFEGRKSTLS